MYVYVYKILKRSSKTAMFSRFLIEFLIKFGVAIATFKKTFAEFMEFGQDPKFRRPRTF